MERVLANLIQNAIKYSPPHTPIGISARVTDDGELELSVEDEGPGIPVDARERIFAPFFRVQSSDQSKVPGQGLGLAICRAIVQAHGGQIQVGDRLGGGASVRVFLPAQVRAHRAKDQGNDTAEHPRSGRRGANATAPLQQSQSQRLRRAIGRRRLRGLEVARGASIRPAAA
jgi:DNA topoisomerase VI subunit B